MMGKFWNAESSYNLFIALNRVVFLLYKFLEAFFKIK